MYRVGDGVVDDQQVVDAAVVQLDAAILGDHTGADPTGNARARVAIAMHWAHADSARHA